MEINGSRRVQRAEDCGGNVGAVYGRDLLLYRGLMASSETEEGEGGEQLWSTSFFFFFYSLAVEKERNDFKFKTLKSFKCTFRKTFLKN